MLWNYVMGTISHLTSSDEPSLIEELWNYFVDRYFSMNFYEYNYQYISVGSFATTSLRGTIAAIFLGVIIAAAISMFQKRTLGDLVRAINRDECFTPDKAKTLSELGLIRNAAIKDNLRRGTALKRVVRCVGEQEYLASQDEKKRALEEAAAAGDTQAATTLKKWKDIPYRYHFDTDRFYIPEELHYGADIHFDKKGSSPLTFLFLVVGMVILLSVVLFLLPELLQLTDNMIGMFF